MHPAGISGRVPAWLLLAGMLWTLPNTLIGLLAAGVGWLAGARLGWRGDLAAVVCSRWPWGPGGAMTLGNCILHTGDTLDLPCMTYEHRAGRCRHPAINLAVHEQAHVYQYMVLGPLFLPTYLLCGGISVANPFERAADRYALTGHGWWP